MTSNSNNNLTHLDKRTIGLTINQQILMSQFLEAPEACGQFSLLMHEILIAAKIIRDKVMLAGINGIIGSFDEKNIHGEKIKKLDIFANDIMKSRLLSSGLVCMIISEEDEEPIYPKDAYYDGKYVICIDPCDGSSNIDCNVPIGTIFGIWKRLTPIGTPANLTDALQIGKNMVCSGYILYGPSCMCIYSTGNGVNGFTYDPAIGEFILTHKNIKYPNISKCYSINEAYTNYWSEGIKKFIDWVKTENKSEGRPYTGRYVGSLVSDFHRNLLYGGIYCYPKDIRTGNGKLRLLYECAPLSMIAQQAGGIGTNGKDNILDIIPTNIHQKDALFIGNTNDVIKIMDFIENND